MWQCIVFLIKCFTKHIVQKKFQNENLAGKFKKTGRYFFRTPFKDNWAVHGILNQFRIQVMGI
jgi:hypothetical protein